ncbi:MAG: hypothetical protein KVP17_000893 [Porospora cf. gigantea B]|uniref:uncharacterized protein n=2 Tax=Porospora cf. gigantea B TaxID=2853592 RepID=UPI003571CE5A|nr:MAG: hypothetical protein KVP17_000893 [Porospora cf. gigantea B]
MGKAPASSKKGTKMSDSRTPPLKDTSENKPPAQRSKIPRSSSSKKTASKKTEADAMKAVGSPPKIDVVMTDLDTALMTDSMTPPDKTVHLLIDVVRTSSMKGTKLSDSRTPLRSELSDSRMRKDGHSLTTWEASHPNPHGFAHTLTSRKLFPRLLTPAAPKTALNAALQSSVTDLPLEQYCEAEAMALEEFLLLEAQCDSEEAGELEHGAQLVVEALRLVLVDDESYTEGIPAGGRTCAPESSPLDVRQAVWA